MISFDSIKGALGNIDVGDLDVGGLVDNLGDSPIAEPIKKLVEWLRNNGISEDKIKECIGFITKK